MAATSWPTSKIDWSCRDIFSCESKKLLGIFLNPRPAFLKEMLSKIRLEQAAHICDESLSFPPQTTLLIIPCLAHVSPHLPDNKLPGKLMRTHIYIKLHCVRSGLQKSVTKTSVIMANTRWHAVIEVNILRNISTNQEVSQMAELKVYPCFSKSLPLLFSYQMW